MIKPDKYRLIAAPMCGNCIHSPANLSAWEIDFSAGTIEGDCSQRPPAISTFYDAWCPKHKFRDWIMEYFEKDHNGALPMIIMVPKPEDNGDCNPLCEGFDSFDPLDKWCNLDKAVDGKPGPGCPQYKGSLEERAEE